MPRITLGLKGVKRLRHNLLPLLGALLVVGGAITAVVGVVGYLSDGGSPGSAADSSTGPGGDGSPEGTAGPRSLPPDQAALSNFQDYQPDPDALRVVIPSISVDAPVVQLGMDDHNIPQIPRTGSDVGWYRFSARPGQGGNVVFVGHINWDRAPAVFGSLDEVKRGDAIRLVANDGTEYVYEVSANFLVDPNDPKSLKVMAPTKTDTVTLITCGGKWTTDSSNPLGGSYDRRRIVQAHPA